MLGSIEGRVDDILITRDGRRIGRLDPVFKGVYGVAEAQIVQDDYDRFRVRIVPGNDYTNACANTIVENLTERVGKADIKIELVKQIERTPSGKFRAVVCNLVKK
jgi:phenylacetate-CoA ligase